MTTITSSAPYSLATASISPRTFSGEPTIDRRPGRPPLQRLALALEELDRLLGRRDRDQLSAPQQRERHAAAGGEVDRLVIGGCGDRPHGDGGPRRLQVTAGLEALPVELGDRGALGVDEVGEGVGQSRAGRPRSRSGPRSRAARVSAARGARAGWRPAGGTGWSAGQAVVEVGQQLGELLGEVVGGGLAAVALERERRQRVGAGGASQSQVDPAREQPGQHREGLGHLERAVVGEHDSAAADPDAAGGRRDRPDQRLGAGAGQHRATVVLGHPVAVIAERVGQPGQVDRAPQRVGAGQAFGDR